MKEKKTKQYEMMDGPYCSGNENKEVMCLCLAETSGLCKTLPGCVLPSLFQDESQ